MRYIIEFTLKDKTKLNCITNGITRDRIIDSCISASQRAFGNKSDQKKFILDKHMEHAIDSWRVSDDSHKIAYGGRQYTTLIVNGYNTIINNFVSAGVKSAYNQLSNQYGQNIPITFIYDVNQVPQKKSSRMKAQQVIKDKKETEDLLNKVIRKAKEIPGIGAYAADIPLLCSMIRDYSKGQYKEVPVGTIIGATAALLYFVSPIDLIPDVIPGLGQLDDAAVIGWALKMAHDDLQEYDVWKNGYIEV